MNKNLLPAVVDLETSGLSLVTSGIWQIGAIDLNNPEDQFLEEARIDDDDIIDPSALTIIGKTEAYLRDPRKQSQEKMLEKFMKWTEARQLKNFICQNPLYDLWWLSIHLEKYGLKRKFHHRSFDLHSIAQIYYMELNKKFLTEGDNSKMGLPQILNFCGLEDERMEMRDSKIAKDGRPHNVLEDCKLTAECFYRLIFGKNLFPKYSGYKIPKELEK